MRSFAEIAFSHTGSKLIPLHSKIFEQFMAGEYKPKGFTHIPFELGSTTVKTDFGDITINFGVYNGNKGITITNKNGIKILNIKHLGNSITQMCSQLKKIIESVANVGTEQEAKKILQNFKETTQSDYTADEKPPEKEDDDDRNNKGNSKKYLKQYEESIIRYERVLELQEDLRRDTQDPLVK